MSRVRRPTLLKKAQLILLPLLLRGIQAVQRYYAGCGIRHLLVQLRPLSNCFAASSTFLRSRLPVWSSRAAASAQCVLKAASSPCVDSKKLLTSCQVIFCTVTSASLSKSTIRSPYLLYVLLTLQRSEELVADSSSILPDGSGQSNSERQLWAAASRTIASSVRAKFLH